MHTARVQHCTACIPTPPFHCTELYQHCNTSKILRWQQYRYIYKYRILTQHNSWGNWDNQGGIKCSSILAVCYHCHSTVKYRCWLVGLCTQRAFIWGKQVPVAQILVATSYSRTSISCNKTPLSFATNIHTRQTIIRHHKPNIIHHKHLYQPDKYHCHKHWSHKHRSQCNKHHAQTFILHSHYSKFVTDMFWGPAATIILLWISTITHLWDWIKVISLSNDRISNFYTPPLLQYMQGIYNRPVGGWVSNFLQYNFFQ